jgi:fructose/tagatose bisphosphate aldolase
MALDESSGGQLLAALTAAVVDDPATTDGGHASAEAVAAGADELARLIGTLHGRYSDTNRT